MNHYRELENSKYARILESGQVHGHIVLMNKTPLHISESSSGRTHSIFVGTRLSTVEVGESESRGFEWEVWKKEYFYKDEVLLASVLKDGKVKEDEEKRISNKKFSSMY